MLSLLALLVAGAYFGWLGLTEGWLGDDGQETAENAPEESCSTPPAVTVRARQVRVSVYNAGAPGGEATQVMAALAEQGFREGELADAPDPVTVEGIVLWPGGADTGKVRLVRRQFPDARLAPRRDPLGPGINVLVGEDFDRLARSAPRSIDVAQPEVCGPVS
jgi:hypothetical protein